MKTLLAVLALGFATGARAQATQQDWKRIEGTDSGVTESRVEVIKDADQWRKVWSEHDSAAPAPAVDFAREDVIAVFLGQERTTAITIRIVVQQDPLDADRINVFYSAVVTKKKMSAQVISYPFAIIKVPHAATIDVEADAPVHTPEPVAPPQPAKHDDSKVKAYLEQQPNFDGN